MRYSWFSTAAIRTKGLWLGATLAAVALICARPAMAQIGIVSVTGGRVEGVTTDGVTSFKGIPFATPPPFRAAALRGLGLWTTGARWAISSDRADEQRGTLSANEVYPGPLSC